MYRFHHYRWSYRNAPLPQQQPALLLLRWRWYAAIYEIYNLLPSPRRMLCDQVSRLSFRWFICVQDHCPGNQPISLKLGVLNGPINRKNWLTFGLVIIRSRMRILGHFSHFPHYCGKKEFRRFIRISHTCTGRFSRHSSKTDADNINLQHFGSDPADIRIRIQINPEILIWIPDHFRLRLVALAEVCALWAH